MTDPVNNLSSSARRRLLETAERLSEELSREEGCSLTVTGFTVRAAPYEEMQTTQCVRARVERADPSIMGNMQLGHTHSLSDNPELPLSSAYPMPAPARPTRQVSVRAHLLGTIRAPRAGLVGSGIRAPWRAPLPASTPITAVALPRCNSRSAFVQVATLSPIPVSAAQQTVTPPPDSADAASQTAPQSPITPPSAQTSAAGERVLDLDCSPSVSPIPARSPVRNVQASLRDTQTDEVLEPSTQLSPVAQYLLAAERENVDSVEPAEQLQHIESTLQVVMQLFDDKSVELDALLQRVKETRRTLENQGVGLDLIILDPEFQAVAREYDRCSLELEELRNVTTSLAARLEVRTQDAGARSASSASLPAQDGLRHQPREQVARAQMQVPASSQAGLFPAVQTSTPPDAMLQPPAGTVALELSTIAEENSLDLSLLASPVSSAQVSSQVAQAGADIFEATEEQRAAAARVISNAERLGLAAEQLVDQSRRASAAMQGALLRIDGRLSEINQQERCLLALQQEGGVVTQQTQSPAVLDAQQHAPSQRIPARTSTPVKSAPSPQFDGLRALFGYPESRSSSPVIPSSQRSGSPVIPLSQRLVLPVIPSSQLPIALDEEHPASFMPISAAQLSASSSPSVLHRPVVRTSPASPTNEVEQASDPSARFSFPRFSPLSRYLSFSAFSPLESTPVSTPLPLSHVNVQRVDRGDSSAAGRSSPSFGSSGIWELLDEPVPDLSAAAVMLPTQAPPIASTVLSADLPQLLRSPSPPSSFLESQFGDTEGVFRATRVEITDEEEEAPATSRAEVSSAAASSEFLTVSTELVMSVLEEDGTDGSNDSIEWASSRMEMSLPPRPASDSALRLRDPAARYRTNSLPDLSNPNRGIGAMPQSMRQNREIIFRRSDRRVSDAVVGSLAAFAWRPPSAESLEWETGSAQRMEGVVSPYAAPTETRRADLSAGALDEEARAGVTSHEGFGSVENDMFRVIVISGVWRL
ncbi:MAG: hypothetical protein ACRC24_03860 [Vibrionaceae bacterium]